MHVRATENHRYDDSADHHKAVWYSGTTTQLATTSKSTLDLSGTTTQPADHNISPQQEEQQLTNSSPLPKQLHGNSAEATTSSNLLRYLNINSNLNSNSLILKPSKLTQLPQLYRALLSSQEKLKSVKNHLPKAVKEQKNYWSTIAKTHEHWKNFVFLKSGDSSLQTGINRKP
ncbi:hypothetical protein F511_17009 [Dorcoceras hygrometricum]|uniref:Uncharacterized protein n=1 Tax=Dorcoceras hygrometricum TaxID=472368 RepID=A0A2Z7BWE5_9LAMI|nr:hypothetical protein F511_17009 [Dorcoceras hygrometricum]